MEKGSVKWTVLYLLHHFVRTTGKKFGASSYSYILLQSSELRNWWCYQKKKKIKDRLENYHTIIVSRREQS